MIGELHVPTLAELRNALAIIVAAGPHTRVALTPQPRKRLWYWDQTALPPVQAIAKAVTDEGPAAILQHVRHRPGPRRPLEIHASPRYIAIDADHGLGDGRFTLELFAAMFAVAGGGSTPWVNDPDSRLALPLGLINTFGLHPNRIGAARRLVSGMRSNRTDPPPLRQRSASTKWSPSYALEIAHVDAATESAVNSWRRGLPQKVGNSAVWLYIVRRALRAAGMAIADDVLVAFDCRRYLPRSSRVNGNFVRVFEIPFSDADALSVVGSRIIECVAAAVPLASMGLEAGRVLLQAKSASKESTDLIAGGPPVMMYTDMSRITYLDNLPWRGVERSYTGLNDPGSANGLTVLNSSIGATRKISMSFNANEIGANLVMMAARHVENPMKFLQGDR